MGDKVYKYKGFPFTVRQVGDKWAVFVPMFDGGREFAGSRHMVRDVAIMRFISILDTRFIQPPVTAPRVGDFIGDEGEFVVANVKDGLVYFTPKDNVDRIKRDFLIVDDTIAPYITVVLKDNKDLLREALDQNWIVLENDTIHPITAAVNMPYDVFVWKIAP